MMRRWLVRFSPLLLGLGFLVAVVAGAQASGGRGGAPALDAAARAGESVSLTHRVHLPLVVRQPTPYELHVNVGGPNYTTTKGVVYWADQPYSLYSGWGYLGGEALTRWDSDWRSVGGTADNRLYFRGRTGLDEYRFDVPNGSYIVRLQFAELERHAVGQRVFDVGVESKKVLDAFDVFAQGSLWYAVDVPLTVTITDGQLNVIFTPTVDMPLVNAIAITNKWSSIVTPTSPSDVRATGSYNSILIDWNKDPNVTTLGYRVYRTAEISGVTQSTTSSLRLAPYYVDDDVVPGRAYSYTVRTIDVHGQESVDSQVVVATSHVYSDSTLPVYKLFIASQDLASLDANVWQDEYVPATFIHDGQSHAVEVRYRGFWVSRDAPKKSWNVHFQPGDLFAQQLRLNLNAEFVDLTLMKETICLDLFEAFGLSVSRADYVLLSVNDEHRGLYTQVEQIDEYFLARTGRRVGSSIYKVNYPGDFRLRDNPAEYETIYEKKTNLSSGRGELIALIELVNGTSDDQFASTILQHLDVSNYLKYYAVIILTANADVFSKDYYLIYDPVAEMWEVLPWDNASTFGAPHMPINNNVPHNLLLTRLLDVPEFRLYYARLLIEAMDDEFSPQRIEAMVDGYDDLIAFDAVRDTWRRYWYRRDYNPNLTGFVVQRKAYLQSVVYSYTAGLTLPLMLERAPAGDRLLLQNRGLLAWDVSGMTLRADGKETNSWVLPPGTVVPAGQSLVLWDGGRADNLLPAEATALSIAQRIELLDKPVHSARAVVQWIRPRTRQGREREF